MSNNSSSSIFDRALKTIFGLVAACFILWGLTAIVGEVRGSSVSGVTTRTYDARKNFPSGYQLTICKDNCMFSFIADGAVEVMDGKGNIYLVPADPEVHVDLSNAFKNRALKFRSADGRSDASITFQVRKECLCEE